MFGAQAWLAAEPIMKRAASSGRPSSEGNSGGWWVVGGGCWVLDVGCWVLGVGCWVLDGGCWMVGAAGRVAGGWQVGSGEYLPYTT